MALILGGLTSSGRSRSDSSLGGGILASTLLVEQGWVGRDSELGISIIVTIVGATVVDAVCRRSCHGPSGGAPESVSIGRSRVRRV